MLRLGEGCAVLLATTITADYLSLLSLFGCALGKAVVHSAWGSVHSLGLALLSG